METVYSSMPWAKDIVSTASPILDALRWLGYGLLRILAYLVDVLYTAIQGLLGINILKIGPVQAFVKRVSPLGWSVLTIALIGAFILLMLYPSRHKGNIARGMFMSVLLMVSIPFMFQMLNSFKDAGVADVSRTISESDSPGQAILIDNTYDVARSTSRVANISSASDPYYLDVNLRIPKSNKTFNKKITSVQSGVTYGEELGNGFFGWGEERLYNRHCLDRLNLYSVYVFFIEYGGKTILNGKKEINALDALFSALPAGHWAKLSYATSKFAEGDMRSSIFGTLASNLELMADEGLAKMTASNEIRFEDLYNPDRPCAIFMVIPDEKPNRHKLASLFIAQSYSALISAAYLFPKQRLPRRVTYVLDEFGLLPRISDMDVKISGCLSRGVSFYLCVQGLPQLEDKYGKTAKSILASCQNIIYVLSQDPDTNKYINGLLSKETVEVETHSGNSGDLLDTHRNTHTKSRELMTTDKLGRMEKGEIIVIRQRSYPIHTKLVPYYELDVPYTQLADIPTGKVPADISDILYPFGQQHTKPPTPAEKEPQKQMENIQDSPQARRAAINACNLKTAMAFEAALKDGDIEAVMEMADALLQNNDITESEYLLIGKMVCELQEKK